MAAAHELVGVGVPGIDIWDDRDVACVVREITSGLAVAGAVLSWPRLSWRIVIVGRGNSWSIATGSSAR